MHVSPTPLTHARLTPLPLDAVNLNDGFWKNWQQLNQDTTIPHGYRMLDETGTINNMRIAIEYKPGEDRAGEYRGYIFQDSDLHKWLEAASLTLSQSPDADIDAKTREIIALLQAAQFPNGYLDSYFTFVKPNQQWTDLEWAHEMYCAGHLIEAGIARKRALGETDLFDIGVRFADHIDATFGEGKRQGLCGHPEIELALVELYRETGEQRYLRLAQYFIDQRGHKTFPGMRHIGPRYMQDRVPVREATEVEGHAVRQLYLCAGVADLYLETGERALLDALERQWDDMLRGKMYLTGGVGARGYGEMFGEAYELPSKEAYCETCAAIASMMWNWRMQLATGEVRYADTLERAIYNGFLSGLALDGSHFFYENPLRSDGTVARQEWYACACCPPNVMRQVALIANYCATTDDAGVQIHQYMNGTIHTRYGDWRVETRYPWDGVVRLISDSEGDFEFALRVPEWSDSASVQVDDETIPVERGAYARITRNWRQGDTVALVLNMEPRFVQSHPYVDATRGSVAMERGPLVYCIEQHDQSADVDDLQVDPNLPLRATWDDSICGGVFTLHAEGSVLRPRAKEDGLYRAVGHAPVTQTRTELFAIPYYCWGNRSPGKMRVWIPME
jgi:DUF1680 family protein